jgi:multidrug efflux pump
MTDRPPAGATPARRGTGSDASPAAKGGNPSTWAMTQRTLVIYAMVVVMAAGTWAYATLGRAEDPPFTIKQMIISLTWPGASADQMMHDVADRVERKLQELAWLDYVTSDAKPGQVDVLVSLKDSTPPHKVPDIWYQVRKKIADMRVSLPQGVGAPQFNDEFGDLYGIVYAFTAGSFTQPELRHVVEDVRQDLLRVPGIGKIDLLGEQEERIYVDFSYRKLAQLGISVQEIFTAIRRENSVAGGGHVDTRVDRVFVRTVGGIDGLAMLKALPIQANGHLIPLGDLASVSRGVVDPPNFAMQLNGKPAIGLMISMVEGGNILDLGRGVAARMREIEPRLPLGVTFARVHDQPEAVQNGVGEFQESFLAALAIVLLVGFVSLGWRTGFVVAVSVPLVLSGVLVCMKLGGIDLHRISLGAMIIALGLLVDDAIISVETMKVKLDEGWDRLSAGGFAWRSTAMPMLTGTLVTVAGYLPVGLANSSTGEYTSAIFWVVGLSLVLSWIVAVLFVPVLGGEMMRTARRSNGDAPSVYDTPIYKALRRLVAWCVRHRWTVIGMTIAAFAVSLGGFALVPQQFFPSASRLELVVDMRLPEGSSFAATAAAVEQFGSVLAGQPEINNYVSYIGRGSPRFFLASIPELTSANFAQIVINTKSVPAREALLARLSKLTNAGAAAGFDAVRMRVARLELGPPVGYPIQFRVSGPDPVELKKIAGEVRRAVRENPHVGFTSDNWGNPSKALTVAVDQNKARMLGLSSEDVSQTLETLLNGTTVTEYREGTDLIPVVGRAIASERGDLAVIGQMDVPVPGGGSVPLGQISTVTYGQEEPRLQRRNRTLTIAVQADILDGTQAPVVTQQILPSIEPIQRRLPVGYAIETAGAVEESAKGQASISAVVPLMMLVMVSLLMVQLRNFGRVLLVLLTAPLGLIGVTGGLLVTGASFGFVAMLGFIALTGIIMRNSVILVDQIEQNIAAGLSAGDAIVEAAVRRTRPILLTAAATVLALIPLTQSAFWGPMAIAIMGGLISATVLTLGFVPALYAAWCRVGRTATTDEGQVLEPLTGQHSPVTTVPAGE